MCNLTSLTSIGFLIFILRHRLEGGGGGGGGATPDAHWHSLHLSLRELSEWAATKEAELEAAGPVGGDELTIRKQQVAY